MDPIHLIELRNLRKVLTAIAEGYPTHGWNDRFIVVKNPDGDAEGVALRGADPNLVIDMEELCPALDQLIERARR